MKKNVPQSLVNEGHPDFGLLHGIASEIRASVGGAEKLRIEVPPLLRETIDDVIQTPRTGRRSYDELEKTEKTYIGTRVEIMLRALFGVSKGNHLDTKIAGHEVDIKHTMGSNWMIPAEALDHVCMLVAADELSSLCYLGLIVARRENLTSGGNRDSKVSVSASGFGNIYWLLRDQTYPPNFWRTVPVEKVDRIFSGSSGNERMVSLFRELQSVPISRETVEAVARQKDPMRRIRADGRRGTRNILAKEGILLLSKEYDAEAIKYFGLPVADFISYKPLKHELIWARAAGYQI